MSQELISTPAEYTSEASDIIRAFVDQHGLKGGLHAVAQAIGGNERRARGLLYREAARIEAHELLALRTAAIDLARRRLTAIEQEAAAIRARLGMKA